MLTMNRLSPTIWLFFLCAGYSVWLRRFWAFFLALPLDQLSVKQKAALGNDVCRHSWKEAGLFMIFYLAGTAVSSKPIKRCGQIGRCRAGYGVCLDVVLPLLRPTDIFVAGDALIKRVPLVPIMWS